MTTDTITEAVIDRVRAVVSQLEDQAEHERHLGGTHHSEQMRQAHMHRATVLTSAIRKLQSALEVP